jgi:transposase
VNGMGLNLRGEKDIEQLRHVALVLEAQTNHLLKVVAAQSAQLQKLTGRDVLQPTLDGLKAAVAKANSPDGPSSAAPPDKQKTRRKPEQPGHGPTQQPLIDKVTRLYEHDAADRMCPQCGEQLRAFPGQYETSEMIDVVDVKYELVTVQQQKYVCRCGGCVETAPGPDRAVVGGRYSLAFAIKVAVDKYLHHLPLERQVRMMKEAGLEVTSQTLWDMVWSISRLGKSTWRALRQHVLGQDVIGLDQTGWPSLHAKKAKKWQMWCLTAPGAVFHEIRDDKGAETFSELVGDFRGYVVCDALATHEAGARDGPGITLAGCWAHIRRKFAESEPDFPESRIMLDMIKELYAIDARAESPEDRGRLRDQESRAVLKRMLTWLHAQRHPKTTSLGRAVRHTVAHWPRLKAFADDPHVWLDNNPTERAFRGPVVGRRNHFGSKSRRGTEAAAILYSLIETAKAAGISPSQYLLEVIRAAKLDAKAVTLPEHLTAAS